MKALCVCLLALLVLGAVQQSDAQACNTTLAAAVGATPELSSLSTVVFAAGLVDYFNDSSLNVTVFAPNNAAIAAFERLLNGSGRTLASVITPNNRAATIVLYHVLVSPISAAQLVDDESYPTQYPGNNLKVDRNATTVQIEASDSKATVVRPDVRVCNSIVHIIDNVLLPESLDDLDDITPYPFNTTPPPPGTPPAPPGTETPPADNGAITMERSTLLAAFAAIAAIFVTL